ncbi:MAG: hypothetical protein IPN54_15415 [Bacteroidetes bacterium]|nr:hypothetical protein [Bacteroidota bacterium]
MRILFLALFFVTCCQNCFSQKIVSGIYSSGLNLAFDELTGRVTGFYHNESGYDEKTGTAQFSCTFYFSGTVELKQGKIVSFYPGDSVPDSIPGNLELGIDEQLTIRLKSEHGGCWNVQSFTADPVTFSLYKAVRWNQIRYVIGSNVDLFMDERGTSALNVKLPFGSVLGISVIKGDFAHCALLDSTNDVIEGWIKLNDLNAMD